MLSLQQSRRFVIGAKPFISEEFLLFTRACFERIVPNSSLEWEGVCDESEASKKFVTVVRSRSWHNKAQDGLSPLFLLEMEAWARLYQHDNRNCHGTRLIPQHADLGDF
jgi:hypothetical protein